VAAALQQALPVLRAAVGNGQPAKADPAERAELEALGGRSVEALRVYRRLFEGFTEALFVDNDALAQMGDELLRLDPGWPRAYALLQTIEGDTSRRARDIAARAAREADRTRDPVGWRLLELLPSLGTGAAGPFDRSIEAAFQREPPDLLAGYLLASASGLAQRLPEAIGLFQRLHQVRPDLQFGADLVLRLRDAGRTDEAARLEREWLQRAPESLAATIAFASTALGAGRFESAEASLRRALLVHGEKPYRLLALTDLLLLRGKTAEARGVASRMLSGSEYDRARGHYRLGIADLLDGRFGPAYEALQAALALARTQGSESELTQILESLRAVAGLLGRAEEQAAFDRQLEAALRLLNLPGAVAAVRFESQLRTRGQGCPQVEAALATVGDAAARNFARTHMLRSAAEAGCGSCAEALRAGRSGDELSTSSLLRLGICAEREGAFPQARDALVDARLRLTLLGIRTMESAFHTVVASFHLARVLARLGERDAARAEYQRFLDRWGHADRPLPEVDEARRALQAQ
jgi:tetratricopeptide (TPR) repeat protein